MSTPWLRTFLPRPDAALRLVCFPHAGGSAAAYRTWAGELPENVETVAVQYPGRAERWAEPAHRAMSSLADSVAEALTDLAARPYVLFGHSMGAALAYETALRLRDAGLPEPRLLVVSGREAPQHSHHGTVHLEGETALLAELDRFGGTSAEVLRDPELRELVLETMAADCELIETYEPTPNMLPLCCAVCAFIGDQDPRTPESHVDGWSSATTGSFDLTTFPGTHFFLVPHRRGVLDKLVARLPAVSGH